MGERFVTFGTEDDAQCQGNDEQCQCQWFGQTVGCFDCDCESFARLIGPTCRQLGSFYCPLTHVNCQILCQLRHLFFWFDLLWDSTHILLFLLLFHFLLRYTGRIPGSTTCFVFSFTLEVCASGVFDLILFSRFFTL